MNRDYAGFSGSVFLESDETVELPACGWGATPGRTDARCSVPRTSAWYKPLSGRDSRRSSMAVLLINNAPAATNISFAWADVPGLRPRAASPNVKRAAPVRSCVVYDVWAHASLGRVRGDGYTSVGVPSHDSAFLTLGDCEGDS